MCLDWELGVLVVGVRALGRGAARGASVVCVATNFFVLASCHVELVFSTGGFLS